MSDEKDDRSVSKSMADWVFSPDYVDKLTGLQEDSNAGKYVEGGRRARRTFREHAQPGAIARILVTKPDAVAHDYLFSISDCAIGMIQSLGVQVSIRSGLTLCISWVREEGFFVQEVWEVENIQPSILEVPRPDGTIRKMQGIQMTLVKDINADAPVDAEHLEDE